MAAGPASGPVEALRARGQRPVRPVAAVQSGQLGGQRLNALPSPYREHTRIAYQSWIGDNWEIMLGLGDASSPLRLTQSTSMDEAPSLGHGCGLIALSRDTDGNDEIYTMRADGSGMQRITVHPSDDIFPALSPDGTRIAFQSYRDGAEPEIYVVNISTPGSAPVRLTQNNTYDGQPSWSPDGQRIAFISARSGSKNVWVMNANGSNPQQLTALTHAGSPKWSPDGRSIALARDDLGTEFTSLWAMNADGSNLRFLWRPTEARTDAWTGGWSFDSQHIVYEVTTWDQEWYITRSYLEAINVASPSQRYRLTEGGLNMAPSWALCDLTPPSSRVNPLPPVSASPVVVSWSGTDAGAVVPSPHPLEYQAQYRLGGSAQWLDWRLGSDWTTQTSASFVWEGEAASVYFRCRARDVVGNVEAWPVGEGDAWTSFMAEIRGHVRDARNGAVPLALVQGPPSTGVTARSAADGSYRLPTMSAGARPRIGVRAEGYQDVALGRPVIKAMELDLYLHTQDEWLVNGGFELDLTGWRASRHVAIEDRSDCFGERAARLGQAYGLSGSAPADEAQPSSVRGGALTQAVRIPADSHQPTLSFMYALGDGAGGPVGVLEAVVERASGAATTVVTLNQATPWASVGADPSYPLWQHAWADLSPWKGQAITLTLRYDPLWTATQALLDHVSVAPWLTPQVTQISPTQTLSAGSTTLTVQGANFVGAQAQGARSAQVFLGSYALETRYMTDQRLTATVPLTVPAGLYDVWVVNPSGHRGGLEKAITVRRHLALPLVRKGV